MNVNEEIYGHDQDPKDSLLVVLHVKPIDHTRQPWYSCDLKNTNHLHYVIIWEDKKLPRYTYQDIKDES